MAKFTSWFKERTTKSTSPQTEKLESGLGDRKANEEANDNHLPSTKLSKVKQIVNQVVTKLPKSNKPLYRRYWFWATIGISGSVFALGYGVRSLDQTLPDSSELNAIVREQTLTIKAFDGTILQQQGEASREQLNIEEIPEKLQKAFISSEDRRFAQHNGVDAQGIVRAVFNNLRSQNVVEGGSTITQQLARILFLKQERTIWRKLKEARLAQKMEEQLSKEEILERYLNLVYLGSGAYGVADAAWVYFSKSVSELTLSEMATIAGLPPAPNRFSPQVNLETAKQRRNLVLQRMFDDNYISATEKEAAIAEPLAIKPRPPRRWEVEAPYFISYIQKELPKYVSPEVLNAGGLTVETTLNPAWQKAAEKAVDKTVQNQGRWQRFQQGALVAVDPRSGEIKVMVGGKNFDKNQFNRVTQAKRQPGSTFKGFVYATAIAAGKSPYQSYLDAPLVVDDYEPKNFTEKFYGQMSLRDALTRSINIIAVKLLIDVGFQPTIKLAHDMGIQSELQPFYSLALGSNEVNLLELTSAYGTFANQGLHVETHGISRILNRQGEVIWTSDVKSKQALDADSAAIMTWMLRNVVNSGTGAAAQLGNRPVAGKTGTTDEARDLWFIGYIPQLVTGVWLGNDNNRPTAGSSGTAAYAWREFMSKAVEGMPVEKFPERPKLEGRKGTIKAQPIKPKRITTLAVSSRNDNSSDSEQRTSRTSRYRRRSSQQEETPRRRRRYSQQQNNDDSTSGRVSRRNSSSSESTASSSGDSSSGRSRRRARRLESDSSSSTSQRRSSSKSISSPSPSWRERLRPSSGQ